MLHDGPDLQKILEGIRDHLSKALVTWDEQQDQPGDSGSQLAETINGLSDRMPLSFFTGTELSLIMVYQAGVEYRDHLYDDEEVLCELAIYPPVANAVPDALHVGPGEVLVFQTSAESRARRVVVQRGDDLLIPQQVQGVLEGGASCHIQRT